MPQFWIDPETRADALDRLDRLAGWSMHIDRWESVNAILGSVDAALVDHDRTALLMALAELDASGPVQPTRIGASPREPAPAPVVQRLSEVARRLGRAAPGSGGGPLDGPR